MKEKEFRWDVTLSFRVREDSEDNAKELIERELEWINHKYITGAVWYKKETENEQV